MLRLAFFSPLPPLRSGISDYSQTLLTYLAPKAQMTLWVDGYTPTDFRYQREFEIIDYTSDPARLS